MVTRLLAVTAPLLLAAWTFLPVTRFAFLNWDDTLVIVDNASLAWPGAWRWALTTMYMEHYQPLSWLAWAGLRAAAGVDAAAFHGLNLALHLMVTALVFVLARVLYSLARLRDTKVPVAGVARADLTAAAAAALYATHPLRVEVVAWVSAMPYALATGLAIGATLAWIVRDRRPGLTWLSLALYAGSLAARPVALGLPIVLVALDWWRGRRPISGSVRAVAPAIALSALAGVVEGLARAPSLAEVSWAYRLQSAAWAPFVYLWRSVAPVGLTPLDALPLAPSADGGVMLAGATVLLVVSVAAWAWRRQWPAFVTGWISFLALLAPAAGLVPSGLQATADRYTYLPGIVLAIGLAGVVDGLVGGERRRGLPAGALAVIVLAASAATARATSAHWTDSLALWTRVVAVQPDSDVGHYNLGLALAEAGRTDEAARHYRLALDANPAHAEARANLDRLDAIEFEAEGNSLAARGELAAAVERYGQALSRDANRARAHAGRGMALATLGRGAEAVPHLREAMRLGIGDAAIPNALAALLAESGALDTARVVLEEALGSHPGDASLAHNLARVLVATPALSPADRARALRLADGVVRVTGGQDARALDTLAAALAANGRMAEARGASARAAAVAEAQGDRELAVQITARGRAYRDPGP